MVNIKEKIIEICNSSNSLTETDLKMLETYLQETYLTKDFSIKVIHSDQSFDMSFRDNEFVINHKKYLDEWKEKENSQNVFYFFKSFFHEYIHALRYKNWQKNGLDEYVNFTINTIFFQTYFQRKGFDFYSANYSYSLVETEAEVKSAQLFLSEITSGELPMFDVPEFKAILVNQINKNRILEFIKPFLGIKKYPMYDTGVIDTIINIIMTEPEFIDEFPIVKGVFDTNSDLIDMLLQYEKEPLTLRKYLIIYLCEEKMYTNKNITEHIKRLDIAEKKKVRDTIDEIMNDEKQRIEYVGSMKAIVPKTFDEKEAMVVNESINTQIAIRKERVTNMTEFFRIVSSFINAGEKIKI